MRFSVCLFFCPSLAAFPVARCAFLGASRYGSAPSDFQGNSALAVQAISALPRLHPHSIFVWRSGKEVLVRRVLIEFLWRTTFSANFLCALFIVGDDIYLSVITNYEFTCKALSLARYRWISFKAGFQLCLWNWSRNSSTLYKFLLLYAAVLNCFCILFLRHYRCCDVDTLRVMRQWSPSRYSCRAVYEMDGVLKT